MPLRFVGKDPDSPNDGSPSVWVDDDGSLVIQGWRLGEEAVGEIGPIPGHETAVRVPRRMAGILMEALR